MKTKVFITVAILTFSSLIGKSQDSDSKNYIWSYEGKKKTHTIGTYAGLSGSYSPIGNSSAYWYGGRVGLVFDKRWTIGIGGNVLNYDKHLDEVVSDGTYRLQAAYAGLFVEYIVPFNNWGKLSVSWLSGTGNAYFEYDKDYRESRPWYQEVIDTEKLVANDIGLEFQVKVIGNWWLGAHATYRLTNPVELVGEDEYFLRNYSAGVSVKWGIF
mgnify:FL=1